MRILAIDTSGKVAAAALYDTETACFLGQQTVYTQRTHSQVILPLAERLLADTGLTLQELDGLAAAKGPGSYTGLRIGIAAVQAMGFALQLPCAGISTLEALARQAMPWQGVICPVMAARQSLVYGGWYRSDGETLTRLQPDGLVELAALEEKLAAEQEPVLLTGDGAEQLPLRPGQYRASPAVRLQNGTGVCLGAAALTQWQKPEELMPDYLQPVKAEKDLRNKRQAQ